jgi:hypothetical protein
MSDIISEIKYYINSGSIQSINPTAYFQQKKLYNFQPVENINLRQNFTAIPINNNNAIPINTNNAISPVITPTPKQSFAVGYTPTVTNVTTFTNVTPGYATNVTNFTNVTPGYATNVTNFTNVTPGYTPTITNVTPGYATNVTNFTNVTPGYGPSYTPVTPSVTSTPKPRLTLVESIPAIPVTMSNIRQPGSTTSTPNAYVDSYRSLNLNSPTYPTNPLYSPKSPIVFEKTIHRVELPKDSNYKLTMKTPDIKQITEARKNVYTVNKVVNQEIVNILQNIELSKLSEGKATNAGNIYDLKQLKEIAKSLGVTLGTKSKGQLIEAIKQVADDNNFVIQN